MHKTDHGIFLNHDDVIGAAREVAELIVVQLTKHCEEFILYPIPRGGIAAAYAVKACLVSGFGVNARVADTPEEANIIIDDLVDSGRTQQHMQKLYPDKPFFSLFVKKHMDIGDQWLIFPWEVAGEDHDKSGDDIAVRLLQFIGENPERGGLEETPKRFIKAWQHHTSGYNMDISKILKTFKDGADNVDEMVLVRDIPVYSHCEHHLAPFFGVAHIAYIPKGKIVGLSKLSRLTDAFALRLQVQERLTNQIADAILKHLEPLGVAVVIECRHMCMESRGIQRQGSATITSAMRGAFRDDPKARAEFFGLVKK